MQDVKLPKTEIKLPKTDPIKPETLTEAEPKPEPEKESNVIYVKAGEAHKIDYSKLKPGTNVIVTYDN